MSRQHYILSSFGSLGDIHPLIGIGERLVERGHRVDLISFEEYAQHAQAACALGMRYVPVGRWADVEALISGLDVNDWRDIVRIISFLIRTYMRETYAAIAARAQPDTKLAAFTLAIGARLASERLSLPLATLQYAPIGIRSVQSGHYVNYNNMPLFARRALAPITYALSDHVMDGELRPSVNAFRRELSLPPLKTVDRNLSSEELVIGLFPDWFAAPQSDWPACTTTTHFPLYDATGELPPDSELAAFLHSGAPPIAFTAGSPTQGFSKFYRAAIEASASLGRRTLLITRYRNELPATLPAGVAHASYVPFSQVLPHVAALVHHGGIGTAAQALRAGVPQLVMPWGGDQFDNAKRLVQLGVARDLPQRSWSANKLRLALDSLITDPSVRASCQQVADRFHGVDVLERTCSQLEQLGRAQERRARADAPSASFGPAPWFAS